MKASSVRTVEYPAASTNLVGQRARESSRELLTEASVLPSQMLSLRSHRRWEGERRLMLAILEQSINSFCTGYAARTPRRLRLAHEAETWLFADDRSWCFSFENICDALGLDPDAIRRVLLDWKRTPPWASSRSVGRGSARGRLHVARSRSRLRALRA